MFGLALAALAAPSVIGRVGAIDKRGRPRALTGLRI
jgi:hypothetical protein